MAGKADLIGSIVDSTSYLQAVPEKDGWKHDYAAPGEFPWQLVDIDVDRGGTIDPNG
jgi:hypothetical protein